MSIARVRHRFGVAEYEQMVELGILGESDRVELIRGEILDKMTKGDRHSAAIRKLIRLLSRSIGDRALLDVQNPIRLADSIPEPDLCLLRPRDDAYAGLKPVPADILLLIEVADSSLDFDRQVKLPLYAENGIPEYWIVNLLDQVIEVHRHSLPNGTYQTVEHFHQGQQLAPTALPDLLLSVDNIV